MSPEDPRHGTYAGSVAHYFAGERPCQPCLEAAAKYRRDRRARLYFARTDTLMAPAIGTHRRIQALLALGHTMRDIDEHVGREYGYTSLLLKRNGSQVSRGTAELFDAAYRELCMVRPEGPYANRARYKAQREGWLPPLAWDDIDDPDEKPTGWNVCAVDECQAEVVAKGKCHNHYQQAAHRGRARSSGVDEIAVERALNGDFAVARGVETRAEVARRWVRSGRSTTELARLSGWNVTRYFRVRDNEEAA